MNINDENSQEDVEVFVVGESYEPIQEHDYVENNNSKISDDEGFAIIKASALLFLLIAVAAGLANAIGPVVNKSTIPFIIVVSIVALLVYLIINASKTAEKAIKEETLNMNIYAQQLKNKSKKTNSKKQKKFNNLEEYRNSEEFKIDESAKQKQKSDDIGLAVDALCRLGLGKRNATEWVERGIASGILSSDTQQLVKFALRRGL